MCDSWKITDVVESGVCNGRSTEMWARYLPNVPITACDWKISPAAERMRDTYDNVYLLKGDAEKLLVPYLCAIEGQVGVFIDGPKGAEAVRLAMLCMDLANVQFVGVHDMAKLLHGKPHAARAMFEALPYDKWFTDEDPFVEHYAFLDADDSHWDEEQGTRWFPYTRFERGKAPVSLGSYGYTIGFLCK
jgi:hypothetical protein